MQMIPVASSNLRAVGYDPSTQTLRIAFHFGTYDYFGVPESVYLGLMKAPSKGQYHHQFIKNSYPANKLVSL